MVLLSTYNICFALEIKKLVFNFTLISRNLYDLLISSLSSSIKMQWFNFIIEMDPSFELKLHTL